MPKFDIIPLQIFSHSKFSRNFSFVLDLAF